MSRGVIVRIFGICTGLGCGACAPDALVDQSGLSAVLGIQSEAGADDEGAAGGAGAPVGTRLEFRGSVAGSNDFELFELGASEAGDEWRISRGGLGGAALVAVLMDENQNLLVREYLSGSSSLRHVLRASTSRLILGVAGVGTGSASFTLNAERSRAEIPATRGQIVYLNFGAGANVRVNRRDPLSFAPFDGAMVGERYVGATAEIKRQIVAAMRDDYAPYDVQILSSDDGPPPSEPHSTLHFGGSDPGLLGLADDVDDYNTDPQQTAVIYVQGFAIYWTMELTPGEMGAMIANVASHELGHLLGLYHTRDPDDVMDTTGTAWDLAGEQRFSRAALENSVFPIGFEDSPQRLALGVGNLPAAARVTSAITAEEASKADTTEKSTKLELHRWVRRLAQQELPHTCGTCLNLNQPRLPH